MSEINLPSEDVELFMINIQLNHHFRYATQMDLIGLAELFADGGTLQIEASVDDMPFNVLSPTTLKGAPFKFPFGILQNHTQPPKISP